MRRLIPFFALSFISLLSVAQFENFDLSKYKLPDIKRHQLDFKFDHNNTFSNNEYEDNETHSVNNFDESLDATYSYFFNSRKKQSNYYTIFHYDIDIETRKVHDYDKEKMSETDLLLHLNFDDRYYLGEEKFFIHVNPMLDFNYNKDRTKIPVKPGNAFKSETVHRYSHLGPKLEFGVGLGRIEPVGDLRQAIYILEDLYKTKRLKRLPNEDEMLIVANKVAELNNKRFFDSRLQKIYEIKSVDSLLNKLGLVENQDAVYFTSLNDLWYYGRENRSSGTRIQFDFKGGLHYSFINDYSGHYYSDVNLVEDTDERNENFESVGISLRLNSDKPIGLNWQRLFSFNSYFDHHTERMINGSESDYPTMQGKFGINSRYGYDWFMNTRTKASLGISGNYYESNYVGSEEWKNKSLSTSIDGSLNYYISPRLMVECSIRMYYYLYESQNIRNRKQFSFSNHITFNYAIF